ncbi:hypothetical protein K503DRAFT_786005 [Rhizopogon vinicolor AM-OR11-026]|uniref:Uncharacterized protein n=1 Tax=Rhizopogon vinicolor AM-OR11-026 TaxID=1314800 RepID=A0A1B7MNE7_9AGAM|nr:hypothetical protein K503DRAFT_786005 [Rhizopogon vinicolor AM-OR11-026]
MSSWLKARDWASGVEYSSLFHSGLRAISLRCPRPRAQSAAPLSSPEKNSRRSSLSYFLKRGTSTKSRLSPSTSKEPSPSCAEKVVRPRPSSMFVSSTKESDELWITRGDFLDDTDDRQKFIQGGADGMLSRIPDSADPFSLAARSRSYYVNLRDSSPLPPKGESFLSLSNDSEALYRSPRRERPVSFQNMPLPSIFSPPCRRDRRERIDPAWMLEESSPELEAQDDGENADVAEINLDGVSDWRQFHVDWLQDEPSVQMLTTSN